MFPRKGHSLQEINRKGTGRKGGEHNTLWLGIVSEILPPAARKYRLTHLMGLQMQGRSKGGKAERWGEWKEKLAKGQVELRRNGERAAARPPDWTAELVRACRQVALPVSCCIWLFDADWQALVGVQCDWRCTSGDSALMTQLNLWPAAGHHVTLRRESESDWSSSKGKRKLVLREESRRLPVAWRRLQWGDVCPPCPPPVA